MHCKVCSNEMGCIIGDNDHIPYNWCVKCDYISIDQGKIIPPSEEKERYAQHENTSDNEGYVQMFKHFIGKIMPYTSHMRKVLDFGCGTGPVLAMLLKEKGFSVDIYDKYFAPEKVYENRYYDCITATEVLEHMHDPLYYLKLFKRHLAEHGIVAIMTLFHPEDHNQFKKWWYRRDNTHISFYTPKTFRHIAHILGMKMLFHDDKNICILGKGK